MSPAGTFHFMAKLGEPGYNFVAVVALDLDDAVFYGSAGATEFLQLLRKGCDSLIRGGNAGDYCDCFAAAMLAIAHNTDDTVGLFWQVAPLPS